MISGGGASSTADVSLDFLRPSSRPGCLGTLGVYEVVDVVGQGGMGIVLRAYDTKLNRVVALKAMAPELARNPMAVKRFLREARAAAAVNHDHVVTIHAIHDEKHPPLIVMEFVAGESLQERLERIGCFSTSEILRIGMQAASGMCAAHEQGIVHRDIKPANILLGDGVDRVKITDFAATGHFDGLARPSYSVPTPSLVTIGNEWWMFPSDTVIPFVDGRVAHRSVRVEFIALIRSGHESYLNAAIADLTSLKAESCIGFLPALG